MTLDQLIGLSGVPLFVLFFLNYAFSAYIATHKLEEIQSHLSNSRFIASYRGDNSSPIIFKVRNLGVAYSLLAFKFIRNMDPGVTDEVEKFPRELRRWIIIPGHINLFCILWFASILAWVNIKDYL
ncbi:hypothetical protein ACIOZM_25855 [Pseudomonas sp. NPDC087346]|uniref:hypothetical protein n=1 Tax=Pseudomonas sp. NPDC087346 TaxID=3364438 RepID=UPI003813A9E1